MKPSYERGVSSERLTKLKMSSTTPELN